MPLRRINSNSAVLPALCRRARRPSMLINITKPFLAVHRGIHGISRRHILVWMADQQRTSRAPAGNATQALSQARRAALCIKRYDGTAAGDSRPEPVGRNHLPSDDLRERNGVEPRTASVASEGRVSSAVLQSPSDRVVQLFGEIGGRP